MITITATAAEKLTTIMDQKGLSETHALRVFVQGGGCGGMQYGMTFDDSPREDDEVYEQNGLKMGRVDFGGIVRETCLAYVPDAQVGDYTIVHVGFALNLIDEAEARKTLELLDEIGLLDEELGTQAE